MSVVTPEVIHGGFDPQLSGQNQELKFAVQLGTDMTFRDIANGLRDPDLRIRRRAHDFLDKMTGGLRKQFSDPNQTLANGLLRLIDTEPDGHAYHLHSSRAGALEVLPFVIGLDSVPLVQKFLDDELVTMRSGAIGALKSLAVYVNDIDDDTVRLPDEFFQDLSVRMSDTTATYNETRSLIDAVGEFDDTRAFDVILPQVTDGVRYNKYRALLTISRLKDPRVPEYLRTLVNSETKHKSNAAIFLGDEGYIEAWDDLISKAQVGENRTGLFGAYETGSMAEDGFLIYRSAMACVEMVSQGLANDIQIQELITVLEDLMAYEFNAAEIDEIDERPIDYDGRDPMVEAHSYHRIHQDNLVKAIAELHNPEFTGVLCLALDNEDRMVRTRALVGLSELYSEFHPDLLDPDTLVSECLRVLNDMRHYDWRYYVYYALAKVDTSEAIYVLSGEYRYAELLYDDRGDIVRALNHATSQEAKDLLAYILANDTSKKVRELAESAIGPH